jgi:hypothetical protein
MAKNTQLSNAAVNAEADALARLLDGGFMDIYDGSQPATADTAITTQNKLASLGINATSAPAAVAGVLTFNAVTADSSADATGTAAWARFFKSDHTTVVMDQSVGTATANVILAALAIQQFANVSVSSWTHTVAKSTAGS